MMNDDGAGTIVVTRETDEKARSDDARGLMSLRHSTTMQFHRHTEVLKPFNQAAIVSNL